jgi:hypothetical protein
MFSRTSLAVVVLGGLAAAVAVDVMRGDGAAVDAPRPGRGAPTTPSARESALDLTAGLRRERFASEMAGDPFAGREAQRSATAAASVPAGPPPFAYRYGGQFRIDTGGWRVYLLKGNDLVHIKVGDVLDGSYKVTAIGAEEFEVVHLPTSTKRVIQYASLDTGSTLAGDQGPSAPQAGVATSNNSALLAGFAGPAAAAGASASPALPLAGAAGMGGISAIVGSGASSSGTSRSSSPGSVTGGPTPSGTLGASVPAAGAPRLGVAPPASGSMPMSPAPAGTMQTLPAPTGRLGV